MKHGLMNINNIFTITLWKKHENGENYVLKSFVFDILFTKYY
jgi:hypothetical protein